MQERLVKCQCQNCRVDLEFDADDFRPGMTVDCPAGQAPTHLYLPQDDILAHRPIIPPPITLALSNPRPTTPKGWVSGAKIFLIIIAFVKMGLGGALTIGEMTDPDAGYHSLVTRAGMVVGVNP